MKKICTAFLLFIPLFLYGQVEHLEEKNKVNAIKKDSAYIYGEGVAGLADDARGIAEDLLLEEIENIIREDISPIEARDISPKDILANACVIQFKRGSMERVFLYLSRDNVKANSRPCEGNTIVDADWEEAVVVEDVIEIEEPVVIEEPIIVEEVVIINEPEPMTKKAIAQDGSWLNRLLAAPDMVSLITLLKAAKEEHKVMWGEVKSRIEPIWYVVPYTENKIEAFLDHSRVDLRTGNEDALSNYSNKKKIWFIIYE